MSLIDSKKDFFESVFCALTSENIESKKALSKEILKNFKQFSFNHKSEIKKLQKPSYASFCAIIHPTRISRPKEPNSNASLAKILHSIAHIEFSAIDLGLDSAYRFRDLPLEYYYDFILLANEEVYHFSLLESLLHSLGYKYGDFPVHENLFNAMINSQSLIDRMALAHKGLEALGLDANPFVARKIERSNHALKNEILKVLNIILNDEINHVGLGVKWLDYAQKASGDTRSIAEILRPFSEFNLIGKTPNIKARLQAGYKMEEIKALQRINDDVL